MSRYRSDDDIRQQLVQALEDLGATYSPGESSGDLARRQLVAMGVRMDSCPFPAGAGPLWQRSDTYLALFAIEKYRQLHPSMRADEIRLDADARVKPTLRDISQATLALQWRTDLTDAERSKMISASARDRAWRRAYGEARPRTPAPAPAPAPATRTDSTSFRDKMRELGRAPLPNRVKTDADKAGGR